MVLSIPADHYQVSFIHTLGTGFQDAVITFGVHHQTGVLAVDALALETAYGATVMSQMNNAWYFTRAVWREQLGAVRDAEKAVQGGNGAPCEPPMVAVLVRKTTGQPGRAKRGRMYFPGISEDGVDEFGNLITGYKGGWTTVLDDFYDAFATNNMEPVILHNVPSLPAGVGDEPTPINGFAVQARVATQRRRNR